MTVTIPLWLAWFFASNSGVVALIYFLSLAFVGTRSRGKDAFLFVCNACWCGVWLRFIFA